MKDVMDVEGDAARNTQSFARYLGKRGANALAAIFYVVAVLLSFVPFTIRIDGAYYHNLAYLAVVLVTDVMLAVVSVRILQTVDVERLNTCRKLSLVAIFIGLVAFLVGAFT